MRQLLQPVLWILLVSISLGVFDAGAYEARSSSVTTWSSSCSGSQRTWWDDMCMAWRKRLGAKGWSQWKRNYEDVIVSRYVDPAIAPWGFDNNSNGFDAGTASLLCTHGGYNSVGWWGLMQREDQGECGANVDQLLMGNASGGSTRFLHLSSCNSLRWDRVNSWFGPAQGGLHTVTGFHGLMYIGSGYVDEYEDMVNDSFSGDSISESWVDNMHHDPIIGNTICPISMAFGSSKTHALNRLYHERYNAQTANSASTHGVLMWMGGCDPNDGFALPDSLLSKDASTYSVTAKDLVMTPRSALSETSTDIKKLVERAFPQYEDGELEARLTDVGERLQSRADRVTVRTLSGVERALELKPSSGRGHEVDTPVSYYRIEQDSGKASAMHKSETYTQLSTERFSAIEPNVRALHRKFFASLGLPTDEIMKTSFRRVLVQDAEQRSDGTIRPTPSVRTGQTLVYRGFGGFPIESAFARIVSYDASRVERFSISWPQFVLHPSATKVVLAPQTKIKEAIMRKVAASRQGDAAVNVVMGVVFRPGRTVEGRLVHLPAMKVIVTPVAKEVKDGTQTDAGLEFYANILASPPKLLSDDLSDKEPEPELPRDPTNPTLN